MSQMRQKLRFDLLPATSGLRRTTDIIRPARLVRFVPLAAHHQTSPVGQVRAKRLHPFSALSFAQAFQNAEARRRHSSQTFEVLVDALRYRA